MSSFRSGWEEGMEASGPETWSKSVPAGWGRGKSFYCIMKGGRASRLFCCRDKKPGCSLFRWFFKNVFFRLCYSLWLFPISIVRWNIQPFFRFSPWRELRLRHFSGHPFGTSRKKASTIFYDTAFCFMLFKRLCHKKRLMLSWNSKGIASQIP